MGEDQLGWDQAPFEQIPGAVQICQYQVEQFGPLHHRGLDSRPFSTGEDNRHRVQRPLLGPAAVAVDVVTHAVVFEQVGRFGLPAGQLGQTEAVEDGAQVGPVLPHLSVVADHLIEGIRHRPVGGNQRFREKGGHVRKKVGVADLTSEGSRGPRPAGLYRREAGRPIRACVRRVENGRPAWPPPRCC